MFIFDDSPTLANVGALWTWSRSGGGGVSVTTQKSIDWLLLPCFVTAGLSALLIWMSSGEYICGCVFVCWWWYSGLVVMNQHWSGWLVIVVIGVTLCGIFPMVVVVVDMVWCEMKWYGIEWLRRCSVMMMELVGLSCGWVYSSWCIGVVVLSKWKWCKWRQHSILVATSMSFSIAYRSISPSTKPT